MTIAKWPFADPPNAAVFTSKRIVEGSEWIQHVTHDEDDGAWQFHSSEPTAESDAALVALKTVFELDPSIGALSDLPLGWSATRETRDRPWHRRRK